MSDLDVVLGATGGVGRALVDALAAQNRRVRAVSRGEAHGFGPKVETMRGDIAQPDDAVRLCKGASVVYFAAQPPYDMWPTLFPSMTASVIAATEAAGAKLVMVDNFYMYGPTSGPLSERTPRRATGPKGTTRIAMEQQLLDAHRAGHVRVAIGRLSDYYGPHGTNSAVSTLVLEPAAKGKAMRWPGSAQQPRTMHVLADAARGLITLGDHAQADGSIWHLPASAPITGQEFMAMVNAALPSPVPSKTLGPMAMRIGGMFSKDAKESVEMMYQWTAPFVSDSSAFTAAFGAIETTPHAHAVRATLAWLTTRRGSSG